MLRSTNYPGGLVIRNVLYILILVSYVAFGSATVFAKSDENSNSQSLSSANQILLSATKKDRDKWPKQYDQAIFEAFDKYATNLKSKTPSDVKSWCPQLDSSDVNAKKLLYSEILYKLTQFESGYNTSSANKESFSNSSGEAVVSTGLLQISYESANIYKCSRANSDKSISTSSLKDPLVNLQCGVLIFDKLIGQNGLISGNGCSNGYCGASRYWSPLRKSSLTEQIKNHVRNSPVCTGKAAQALASAKQTPAKPIAITQAPNTIPNDQLSKLPKPPVDVAGIDEDDENSSNDLDLSGASLN